MPRGKKNPPVKDFAIHIKDLNLVDGRTVGSIIGVHKVTEDDALKEARKKLLSFGARTPLSNLEIIS